jgi:hypothetical protein
VLSLRWSSSQFAALKNEDLEAGAKDEDSSLDSPDRRMAELGNLNCRPRYDPNTP